MMLDLLDTQSGPARLKLDRRSIQLGTDNRKDSASIPDGEQPFTDQRGAALALLNSETRLTRKAGSFLGQCVADPAPLSRAQRDWLETLLRRAELPPFLDKGEQHA